MRKVILCSLMLFSFRALAQDKPVTPVDPKDLNGVLSVLDPKKTSCDANALPAAVSTGLCKDLAKFTCAPGSFNDGTGTITSGEIDDRVENLKDESKTSFAVQFQTALKDPKNIYFKKIALSALGLTDSPDCQSSEDSCNAKIARGLSTIAMRRIFPHQGYIGGSMVGMYADSSNSGGLSDLDLLTQNPKYLELENSFSDHIKTQLDHKKALDNVRNNIFPQIKALVEKQIQNSVSDAVLRKNLVTKVDAIQFAGDDCGSMSGGGSKSSISSLLVPNAFYEPTNNTFTFCNGFLINGESDFQIAGIIAHELGHSIDPCGITRGPSDFSLKYSTPSDQKKDDAEFPFKGVAACLRSSNSVHAEGEPPPSTENFPGGYQFGMAATADTRPTVCNSDQITESFADWTLSNVLPEYIAKNHPNLTENQYKIGYSNVFRSLCDNTKPAVNFGRDMHPPLDSRINRIILVQPKIRAQMGCPITPPDPSVYCAQKGESK